MAISLFGWLDNIPVWASLPYPTKGAILRAAKAALSGAVGILLAAVTEGNIFPEGTAPLVVLVVTATLQAADKFIRETAIENEAAENDADLPLIDEVDDAPIETNTDATVVTPNDLGEVAVETDATVIDGAPVDPDAVSLDEISKEIDTNPDPIEFDDPIDDRV